MDGFLTSRRMDMMPSLLLKTDPKVSALPMEDPLWAPDEVSPPKPSLAHRILIGNIVVRSHFLKLFCLMMLASIHAYYLNSFITTFRAYESLDQAVEENISSVTESQMVDVAAVRFIMRALIDYKKNLWITVGAMCASLATTSFLLLIAEDHRLNSMAKALVCVTDFCAFAALPCLLAARRLVAVHIAQFGHSALMAASRLVDVNDFMENLGCSVSPRQGLPVCADTMLDSIFPVKVLEYLIILAVLTGAYIGLAYLIQYCIRHWFPPSRSSNTQDHHNQPLVLEA